MAFTKVVGAGIHTLSNITSHNIHSSGIVTATGLNISGNATIGGVLTYEDVTSIDSVGVITARSDLKLQELNLKQLLHISSELRPFISSWSKASSISFVMFITSSWLIHLNPFLYNSTARS